MKIALLAPDCDQIPDIRMENLSLAYLAAVLREASHEVAILDASLYKYDRDCVVDRIVNTKCDLLGISISNPIFLAETQRYVEAIRMRLPACFICLGGYLPTAQPEILRDVSADCVIYGEGEHAIVELCRYLGEGLDWHQTGSIAYLRDGNITINRSHGRNRNLDKLPRPARDTLADLLARGGVASISSSRGCYGGCSFCIINSNNSRYFKQNEWIPRSAMSVVDEMEQLRDEYGIHEVWFIDPNFIGTGEGGRRRILDMVEEINRRKLDVSFSIECRVDDIIWHADLIHRLSDAGLRRVYMGLESGDQEDLDMYAKGTTVSQHHEAIRILDRLGLSLHIGMIYYHPFSTLEGVKRIFQFVERIGTDNEFPGIGRNALGLLPGTPITEKMRSHGIEADDNGLGYAMRDKRARDFSVLINRAIREFPGIYEAERESWRDAASMVRIPQAIECIRTIRKYKNTFVIAIATSIFSIVDSEEYENTSSTISKFKQMVRGYRDRHERLSGMVREYQQLIAG